MAIAAGQAARWSSPSPLVLVVEDEVLIAMHLEHMIERHGWRVLGPAPTVARALRLLENSTPDVALLDVNLRGELVTPVAEARSMRKFDVRVQAAACSSAA